MTIGELWRRVVHLARGARASDELREEMALHVELRTHANRAAGIDEPVARELARRSFGNESALRGESRNEWRTMWIEHGVQDVRFALRRLAQRPAFAAAVIGILALGIGATTAVFSAVDAAMLRPLPFRDPAKLVTLEQIRVPFDRGTGVRQNPGPQSIMIGDVRAHPTLFSHVAAYAAGALNLSDPDHPSRLRVGVVSSDFFETLGAAAATGRTFNANEGVPNGPRVVVLSSGFWQRQFGGAPAIGKTLVLNNNSYQVIGVMPRGFGFPSESDVWIPMSVPTTFDTFAAFRGFLPVTIVARISDQANLGSASAWLSAEWTRRAVGEPGSAGPNNNFFLQTLQELKASGTLKPLQRDLAGTKRTALLVILGATTLLLLVTCANVTNLLLSQAAMRRHEIAMRAMLGASRGRIVRQLLTESIVLSVVGTALGIALAPAILGAMRAALPAELNGVAPATIDLRVLAFASALALVTGVASGLWPAVGTARSSPSETIKSGGRSATFRGSGRARRFLVGAELAMTAVLLVGSLLMLRSFSTLMALDRGMITNQVGTLEIAFPGTMAGGRADRLAKIEAIVARVAAIPGVAAAGAINDVPLGAEAGVGVQITLAGELPPSAANVYPRYLMANGSYFAAMGITVKRGRIFTAADDSLAPPVAVISESVARAFWPGADPVGQTFDFGAAKPITVVGVVADVRELSLADKSRVQLYFPISEQTPTNVAIVARGPVDPWALLAQMREAVRAVDPAQAVFHVRMMDEVLSASVASRRTNTVLITAFAAVALLLSAVGTYAVVSFSVTQRRREFGIRSALGSSAGGIMRLVAREMAAVGAIGLAVGIAGAWAASKVLTSLIYGVTAHDPWTFVLAPLVLLVPAFVATALPARRAAQVNPVEVMRAE